MSPSLKGKVLFITGASRGIGEAIALKAAKDGAKIAVVAKTTEPHPTLPGTIYTVVEQIKKLGGDAIPIKCDIRDEKQVEQAIKKTVETFGGIDIVINNASAINITDTENMTLSRYDLLQSINARGAWVVSKYAIPYLKKAKNPHILTLSPPLSMDPHWFNGRTAYTMSKYGMSMTVLGLSAELEKYGIGVNALWPLTTIGTAALIIVRKTNPDLINRTPEIMADAAHVILTSNSKECTGNFFIDEVVLREYGVRDFSKYIETPGTTDADMTLDGYIEESTLKHLAHLRNIQSRL